MKKLLFCFLILFSITGKSQIARDGEWTQADADEDDRHGKGLVIPSDWPYLATWTSVDGDTIQLPKTYVWPQDHDVRDQGQCGSCWVFATTSVAESLNNKRIIQDLSEQDVLSCSKAGSCGGGFFNAFDYMKNHGVTTEKEFPYRAADVRCVATQPRAKITSWSYIGKRGTVPTETEIKTALMLYGPIAVVVNGSFGAYRGGIFNKCNQSQVNHMVVI